MVTERWGGRLGYLVVKRGDNERGCAIVDLEGIDSLPSFSDDDTQKPSKI